jgi:hypothetical protein
MPLGPGKYDELCTHAREMAKAEGVAIIVLKGSSGSGFSVQGSPAMTLDLPRLLRAMADEIEKSFAAPYSG